MIGAPLLEPLLWLLPPMTVAIGFEQACAYWMTRQQEFGRLALVRLSKSITIAVLPLALAACGHRSETTLICGTAAGQAVALLLSACFTLWPTLLRKSSQAPLRAIASAAAEYRQYPLYIASYSFASQFSRRVIFSLFAIYATTHVVGLFAFAVQLTMLPTALVTTAMSQVFYPKIQTLLRDGRFQPFVLKALWRLAIVTAPWFMLAGHFAPLVAERLLPEKWADSGLYIAAATAPCFAMLLTSWLPRVYDVMQRQRLAVVMQVLSDLAAIGLVFAVLASGCSAATAATSYFSLIAIYNVVWLLVTFRIVGISIRKLAPLAACTTVLLVTTAGACTLSTANASLTPTRIIVLISAILALQAAVIWTWKAGNFNAWILTRLERFLGPTRIAPAR
ncbi:hypothetical protein MalM25_26430 [Planctomycetes bacterium MalM25]|nr:hypothetical protein MalM25_26430 [Planctomycetes bacterium MalM25]